MVDDGVREVTQWAEFAATDMRYRIRMTPSTRIFLVVPEGEDQAEIYQRAEGALNARGVELDWRNHPDELVRRTVVDTLRTVASWAPHAVSEQDLLGPAFAVRGWTPNYGSTCPVCQHTPCEEPCPMRRVGMSKYYTLHPPRWPSETP